MNLMFMDADEILSRFLSGAQTFPDEANFLCAEASLASLAPAARTISLRHNPEGQAGYAVSKSIIYSNVCQPNCPFCQGTVTLEHPEAFTKTADEVVTEAAAAVAAGATQILLQGGHRIDLPWEYYTGLVRAVKERFPAVQVLAYSPSEIMVFNVLYQKRTAEVIGDLQAAGMGALLAGGGEALATRVPEYQALLRGPWNEWFDVIHRCADASIPVVAPFVFGIGETVRERVGHLYRVKAVQERTRLKGRPAFAALHVFSPSPEVSENELLRMVALARVLVPNVPHVVAGRVAACQAGADDLGGLDPAFVGQQVAALAAAGLTPVRRTGW